MYEALGDEDCDAGDGCDCRKSSAHEAEDHCGGEADSGTCDTARSIEYRRDSHCGEACVWNVKQKASDESVGDLFFEYRERQHPYEVGRDCHDDYIHTCSHGLASPLPH